MFVCLAYFGFVSVFQCPIENNYNNEDSTLRYEEIQYYKCIDGKAQKEPYKSRVEYFYENGLPHQYIIFDSIHSISTEYIYQYDENWVHTGALYREDGDPDYSIERVSYTVDSSQTITEWVDSNHAVYYTMIEYLDTLERVQRASFEGDELHGFDTTYYTSAGFIKQVFFTNVKGRRMNDRSFNYTEVNQNGDWTMRYKIMGDTINEQQIRKLSYNNNFFGFNGIYMPGVISMNEWDENMISFSDKGESLFLTRSIDWTKQMGYVYKKSHGLFTDMKELDFLDTIYNGAISPSGKQIIYCKRLNGKLEIWLTKKTDGKWNDPVNLSSKSGIEGGYFHWINENEISFYINENKGDIVSATISNDQLSINKRLKEINSNEALEFSPYFDKEKRFIIFTRYLEGVTDQQGIFISHNKGKPNNPLWTPPIKIEELPYGWGFAILDENIIYTDGNDIRFTSIDILKNYLSD